MSDYKETSIDDLRYYLVEGALDNTLNVICSDTIQSGQVGMTARIIGSSHHITLRAGDERYQEVVACTELKQDGACYAGKADVEFNLALDQLRYNFNSTTVCSHQINDGWGMENPDLDLKHTFPGVNRFKTQPITHIKADLRDGVTYETLHNYPNEQQAFLTRTTLTIKSLREAVV